MSWPTFDDSTGNKIHKTGHSAMVTNHFPRLVFASIALVATNIKAQDNNQNTLQSAITNSAQKTKAAVFLDVQGCGITFSNTAGIADRVSKRKADINMPLRLGSIGKLYTAAVIHRLSERGLVDIDASASRYLTKDDAVGVANKEATLRQFLNHTAGIPDYYDSPKIKSWNWKEPLTPQRIMLAIKNLPATGQPGSKYSYSNSGYHVLALVAERATGKSFATLVQTQVIGPTKLTETYYNTNSPKGALHGYVGNTDLWQSAENTGPDSGVTATITDTRQYLRTLFMKDGALRSIGQAMSQNPIETGKERQQAGAGAEVRTSREGLRLIGHTGYVEGYLSFAYFAPDYGLTMVGHMTSSDNKDAFAALLKTTAQAVQTACVEGGK